MLDRRKHRRFKLAEPARGVVRVFRDVILESRGHDEWIAISREPGVTGETLMLGVPDLVEETARRFPVRVMESRPVMVDGEMRHRIRLQTGVPK